VQQLRDEGLDIQLELADRQQHQIRHADMPEYYAQLDLYVCASKMEGTPNPVLEAAACGVPILSTNVGVVPQVFGSDPFGEILPERSVPALTRAIRRRYHAGALQTRRLSAYNLRRIQPWGWSAKAENFRKFFKEIAEQQHVHDHERLSA
jgi:glycosyltransferase involved in cell wall biosynthesis